MRTSCVAALAAAVSCAAGADAEILYGVTANQTLVSFRSSDPGAMLSGVAIAGLQANEQVRGIDFRPATGELFALGSFSNLYTINAITGAASLVGSFGMTLDGSSFGFDFNPTIDRIRVVSDVGQNLVLNPNNGAATVATPLFFNPGDANEGANPSVVSAAYTNSFAGATTTQLYSIDTGLDILVTQANSFGNLGTVGSLGVDITDVSGFDISGLTGIAYLAGVGAGDARTTLWRVDLSTGLATSIGEIGGGATLTAIAVVPAPAPAGAFVVAAGLLARRRRV